MNNIVKNRKLDRTLKTVLFITMILFFAAFLVYPLFSVLKGAFLSNNNINFTNFKEVFSSGSIWIALKNSIYTSLVSSIITTLVALIISIGINFTNINTHIKKLIEIFLTLPMLLPTITYGFAIMYTFGRQGIVTKLFGQPLFNIYGMSGIMLGYFIYTLPVSFILLNNGMKYIDKRYSLVSTLLYDGGFKNFFISILIPLRFTIIISIIQSFFLSFTDFGIPASLGGRTELIAKSLYEQMMGSVPDFNKGAVIALMMMLPSILSVVAITLFRDKNVSENISENLYIRKNSLRDIFILIVSSVTVLLIFALFAGIIFIPLARDYPYDLRISTYHIQQVLKDNELVGAFTNSIVVAFFASIFGCIISYIGALFTTRKANINKSSNIINFMASIINTVPGMVLGIAYLIAFSGTAIHNTLFIVIICDIVHYFSTPYLMFKDSLAKLNQNWEITSDLLGDSWFKTIRKILIPNSMSTIVEVFAYYFVNNMVTVSAVIFITGAKTMVITAKIKELQYFMRFNDIFVVSTMILITNIIVKFITNKIKNKRRK